MEKMSMEWLASKHDINGLVYDSVYFRDGDASYSAEEFTRYMVASEGNVFVYIDGNLTVDGHLSVDDPDGLLVAGDVNCTSFWIGEVFSSAMICI